MNTILYFILLAISFTGQEPPAQSAGIGDQKCGAFCLFVALKALGVNVGSLEDLEQSMGSPSSSGYTLEQVQASAQKYGLHAVAVETTVRNLSLRKRGFCCITLLSPSHYVLLYDVDETRAFIVDPPRETRIPINGFLAIWSKKCLILSKEPLESEESIGRTPAYVFWLAGASGLLVFLSLVMIAKSKGYIKFGSRSAVGGVLALASLLGAAGCGRNTDSHRASSSPGLSAAPRNIDLGKIYLGEGSSRTPVAFLLTNTSEAPIRIISMSGSCSCTKAGVGKTYLEPGEKTRLDASIQPGDLPEDRRALIYVESDDPMMRVMEVPVTWTVENPLKSKPERVEAVTKPGELKSLGIILRTSGMALCPSCSIEGFCDNPLVNAEFRPLGIRDAKLSRSHEGAVGTAVVASAFIRLLPSLEESTLYATLRVRLSCNGKIRASLSVPIVCHKLLDLEASPRAFSLGAMKSGEQRTLVVKLKADGDRPFRVTGVSCSDPQLLKGSIFASAESSLHSVEFKIEAPNAPGPRRGVLSINIDPIRSPLLEVPFSGIVRK